MSDVDWENYSKETMTHINSYQKWCADMLRTPLSKTEKHIVVQVADILEVVRPIHQFSLLTARSLSNVDDKVTNLRTLLNAINESIGDMGKRVGKLEDK